MNNFFQAFLFRFTDQTMVPTYICDPCRVVAVRALSLSVGKSTSIPNTRQRNSQRTGGLSRESVLACSMRRRFHQLLSPLVARSPRPLSLSLALSLRFCLAPIPLLYTWAHLWTKNFRGLRGFPQNSATNITPFKEALSFLT